LGLDQYVANEIRVMLQVRFTALTRKPQTAAAFLELVATIA